MTLCHLRKSMEQQFGPQTLKRTCNTALDHGGTAHGGEYGQCPSLPGGVDWVSLQVQQAAERENVSPASQTTTGHLGPKLLLDRQP